MAPTTLKRPRSQLVRRARRNIVIRSDGWRRFSGEAIHFQTRSFWHMLIVIIIICLGGFRIYWPFLSFFFFTFIFILSAKVLFVCKWDWLSFMAQDESLRVVVNVFCKRWKRYMLSILLNSEKEWVVLNSRLHLCSPLTVCNKTTPLHPSPHTHQHPYPLV